jgi:hypothetical protein
MEISNLLLRSIGNRVFESYLCAKTSLSLQASILVSLRNSSCPIIFFLYWQVCGLFGDIFLFGISCFLNFLRYFEETSAL